MKINSKKTLLVLAAVALVGGTFTAVAITKENGFSVSAAEDENTIWKHYAAVAPDPDKKQFGSKEFWANCSEIGTHVFEAPTIGKIQDGGDFSKTAYFKELTPEDDRYVPYEYTVTFDSNGATAIDPVTVGYGKTLTAPVTPTRAEDAYYKAYTFDAWYVNGKAFDFAEDTIKESVTLTAGWKYGDKKFDEVTLTKDSVTFNNGSFARGFDEAFSNMAWENGALNAPLKKELIEGFGGTARAADGLFASPSNVNGGSSLTLPLINFKEKLAGGKIMTMELGAYNSWNSITYQGKTLYTNKVDNEHGINEQVGASLTRMKTYFYLDGEAVKARFVNRRDTYGTNIFTCDEIALNLTAEEANGTKGVEFGFRQGGTNRQYWFGNPRIVNGESTFLDFSKKENVAVVNGVLQAKGEEAASGAAPWGQWRDSAALSIDGVGVLGNGSTALKINYPAINFNGLFGKGQGLRFVIGSWNGQEQLKFGETSFGTSGVKPGNPIEHTANSIVNTWQNFQIEVTKTGMRVTNHFENKEYMVALTANQLAGKEGLTFEIGSRSNGHFFYIANAKTFHA